MNEPMNPPRTFDELLAAATKGPAEAFTQGGTVFAPIGKLLFTTPDRNAVNAELAARYWNHGPEMVMALRKQIVRHEEALARVAEEQLSGSMAKLRDAMIEEAALREGADEARAVLAALDGKDAT